MSSILDALEKIEATGGPQPPSGPGEAPRPQRTWSVAVLVVVAIVAGATGAALVLGRRATTEPVAPSGVAPIAAPTAPARPRARKRTPAVAPVASPTLAAPTTAPALPAAPAPAATPPAPRAAAAAAPPPPQISDADAKAPLIAAMTPPPTPPATPAPRVAAPVPAPAVGSQERPWGSEPESPKNASAPPPAPPAPPIANTAPPAPAPAIAPATPPAPPPAPRATVEEAAHQPNPRVPAGAPRMRVSFLVYSSAPERRSVALTIDESGLTTLHEGEESNGLEVVRIHPDCVDLRWQGQTFTLEVRS